MYDLAATLKSFCVLRRSARGHTLTLGCVSPKYHGRRNAMCLMAKLSYCSFDLYIVGSWTGAIELNVYHLSVNFNILQIA